MPPPMPPEEIAQLMQFIVEKTKNVTSPMNVSRLAAEFKEQSGSLMPLRGLRARIERCRQRIHKMDEFDMETKVKMMFAVSASIDARFLSEMRKEADVEVDAQQRIICYKKNDGGLELCANHMRLSIDEGEQRDKSIIQSLIEKTKTVDSPMVDALFVKEIKDITGCLDSLRSLNYRYRRVKNTIFEIPEINKNTKVKMMYISNTNLSEDILEELRKDAVVEVDKDCRITKYKANDGSLELEGDHCLSSKIETAIADIRRQREANSNKRKRARGVSVKDDDVEESLKIEDPPSYELDIDHIPAEKKPESLMKVNIEVPDESSTSTGGDHFFFDYDPQTYENYPEHIPEEKKPESLIEVKTEVQEKPSTSNVEYPHCEENLERILTEPKREIFK